MKQDLVWRRTESANLLFRFIIGDGEPTSHTLKVDRGLPRSREQRDCPSAGRSCVVEMADCNAENNIAPS
jgi:hypothetical protein